MSDFRSSRLKKTTVILLGILVFVVIGLGVYFIVSMSNTLSALNDKLERQQSIIAVYEQATPEPTPSLTASHSDQLSELDTLYNQKKALLDNYRNQVDSIKKQYDDERDFNDVFNSLLNVNTGRIKEVYDSSLNKLDQFDDPTTVITAIKCAYYASYIQENEQVLIDAKGIIDLIKTNYSENKYIRAKDLLNSIQETTLS